MWRRALPLLPALALAADDSPNVQLYPCGGDAFGEAQRWHLDSGRLRLASAAEELAFLAPQQSTGGVRNALLASSGAAAKVSFNASSGKIEAADLGLCLTSDDASAHGYLPNAFFGSCEKADSWEMREDGTIRTQVGRKQCLDVGSGGSGVGKFVLPLLPAAMPNQQAFNKSDFASWGGSVIRGDDGKYHMFVAVFANGSGLKTWTKTSEIMHAISDVPEGPFEPLKIIATPFAHNPEIVRANDGTYLLSTIGKDMLVSKSLYGPWEKVPHSGNCNNPTVVVLPGNDTVFRVCHGGPYASHYGVSVQLQWAPSWKGPWTTFRGNKRDLYDEGTELFAHPVEDPTMWVTSDGTWHMLLHAFRMGMLRDVPNPFGGYAYSRNGPFGPWIYQENVAAYTGEVTFVDGSKMLLRRRERPKILRDATGRPTHLYNGVCPPGNHEEGIKDPAGHCFTLVQKIDPNVPLWNHDNTLIV